MRHQTLTVGTGAIVALGPGRYGAIVQADSVNTGVVYLGAQNVTADTSGTGGFALAAGASLPIRMDGPDFMYAIGSAAGQILRVLTAEPDDASGIG